MTRVAAVPTPPRSTMLDGFLAEIEGIETILDPLTVRRRSRDFFWYSPVLNAELNGKSAEVVVRPADEAEVIRIAAAAARHRIALTPRGGGTGNYGQAVPLAGGAILDMTAFDRIEWSKPWLVRVEAGARMHDVDAALRPGGWELRMHPSTKRTATIGGFVAGGSGGVGSVTYGGLREAGNIAAARIVTVEARPRSIELAGDAAQKINRAYGTTGIITALEMPLAPAWPWIDVVVACDDFEAAFAAGRAVARADGVVKKLVTPIDAPLTPYFGPLKDSCPAGKAVLIAMIAEPSMRTFRDLVAPFGSITHEVADDESAAATPIYEYAWNHTTLQVLKVDRGVTYLQCLFPFDRLEASVAEMRRTFGDEVIYHCEFIRFAGNMTCSALPVVRYTTKERLDAIIAIHEAAGVLIANPHVFTLEEGSRHKRADADQIGFKAEVDPHGLLNPGKMRSYVAVEA